MPEPEGPIFDRSVNPISTGEGRLSPPITTGTPNVFHLPASLIFGKICAYLENIIDEYANQIPTYVGI